MFRTIFFILFLAVSLYSYDKIYFLPDDAKKAKNDIISLINDAKKKIDIAMYNYSYKKFDKALKKVAKKGVTITLIYGKTDLKLSKDFVVIKPKRKQHIKLAIIDDKMAIYGSSNWTKKSFKENYELINITNDKERVEKFIRIIENLKGE